MKLDQLTYVSKVEAECRAAFDAEFHKVKATMTYDQWRAAFKVGWKRGREDCLGDWAAHMVRMADSQK